MWITVLFRAYEQARNRMFDAEVFRGRLAGISTANDEFAQTWQRYRRVAEWTRRRIYAALDCIRDLEAQ
jgi:hypothetical protein